MKRNTIYRRARITGRSSLWSKYTSLRNEVVKLLRQSKKEHLKRMSNLGSKQLWKTIKSAMKSCSQIPTLRCGSTVASSNTDKASLLNVVLSKNFNDSLPPLSRLDYQDFMVGPSTPPPDDILCTEEEVLSLLNSLDTSKASGPDGISGKMLKSVANSITPILTKLFNMSIRSGSVPHKWKVSSVVPIPKAQTNKDSPSNYRPISLPSLIGKLMERHIYTILFEHLTEKELISMDQWGFCPGKSTVTALVSTFHNILKLLEDGLDVSLVFLDLRKAFDSVPHRPLLQKLKDIDLDQHILQWIASYLLNRQQYVVVNGASSSTTPVLSGVPQGSVLGPLLFITYLNHVPMLRLSDGSKLSMYADDILLYKPINGPKDYCRLQSDLDAIHECISASFLTLNPLKCKYIVCSRKRHPCIPPTGLLLAGTVLEQVESYRYLGVLVTSRLTWSDHIEQICTKARRLIGMLYRQFYRWADTSTLLNIYLTCIRPHLEYACQLWDPFTDKSIQALEAVQKFACKVCLKQWNLDYDTMLQFLNLPPLSARRQYLKLTTMYNIVNGSLCFPSGIFVQSNFPYHCNRSANFARPFARTNYLFHSFVPNVISLWNNLPSSVKTSSSVSTFKNSCLYHLYQAHVSH